jgi:S1-C subfamily serine protease
MQNKTKYGIALLLAVVGSTMLHWGCHRQQAAAIPKNNTEYSKTSVMITNDKMNSGGSGVIIDSRPGSSHVLTNKHVCQLIQVGGKVITDDGTAYPVDGYQVYKKHDLCLVEVMADLGTSVKIATQGPNDYDYSMVVGHPSLLPTIISSGHFSQHKSIDVMVDTLPCDGSETDEEIIFCAFFRVKPLIKTFQSQVISNFIMPGSSGSPVFNDKGELSGLIFAGSEGLSYGYIVPWEYVQDFLNHKDKYQSELPDASRPKRSFFAMYFDLQDACTNNRDSNLANICRKFVNLGLYNE